MFGIFAGVIFGGVLSCTLQGLRLKRMERKLARVAIAEDGEAMAPVLRAGHGGDGHGDAEGNGDGGG